VVAPYFLSRGRHIQEDIPALVGAAQLKYPGTKCIIADPIGVCSVGGHTKSGVSQMQKGFAVRLAPPYEHTHIG
jgi:sirohydrochlorin ferrochelatase